MIFKHYIYHSEYIKKEGEAITKLDNYEGSFEGYFQDHEVGMIFFAEEPETYFQIGSKKYTLESLKEIRYSARGSKREVEFIDANYKIMDKFNYEAFWIDELDALEIAFGLPDDDEKDLLKYISNRLNQIHNIQGS